MKKTLSVLLALLCAVLFSLPASAEGFSFGWDTDSKNPDGPHCKAYLMLNLDTDTVVYCGERRRAPPHGLPHKNHELYYRLREHPRY